MTSQGTRSRSWLNWILLALGVAVGAALAYLDSRPGWDDAGIIAGGLLLAAGALTLAGFRPPWLMALGVGLWVPIRGLLASGDFTLLVVLVFPFLGAYAGYFVNRAISPTMARR